MAGGVWVAVNASMKGFASTVLKETSSTAKRAGKQFENEFSSSGKLAGASLARAVESQTSKLATARNAQAQATKNLKTAEQELANIQNNSKASAVQIAAAEEKLSVARAKAEDATRRVTRDEAALDSLRETGVRASTAAANAEDKAASARITLVEATGRLGIAEADLEAKKQASEAASRELAAAEQRLGEARKSGDAKTISDSEKEFEKARKASDKASLDAAKAEGTLGEARVKVQNATDQLSAKQKTHASIVKEVADAQTTGSNATIKWGETLAGLDHPISGIMGKLTSFAGIAAGGLGLAGGVSFFSDAITQGMELDRVMGSLQAVTGSTGEVMAQVSAHAKQLGMDESLAGTSAASATDAMLALAKGGLSVQESMDAAKGSIQLAGAAQIDASQAADIQISTLNSFSLAADQAGRVADVLTNAANNSATGVTEMAESLKYAAPSAATLGVSLEDASTMLGLFANNGLKGSEAGTALRSSLLSMASPSKQQAQAMEELGLSAFDAQGKFVGLASVADQLSAAQGRMSDEAFVSAAATAFGSEAVSFATVAAKGGAAAFEELRGAMDRQGSAGETAGAKLAGMNGALDRFNNAMDDAKLRVYELIAPTLTQWLDSAGNSVTRLADSFSTALGFMERHPDVMKTIAGAAAGVVGGFAAIKAAQAGLWAISFTKEFAATLKAMPALLRAQATGTQTATVAQHGFNTALRANPIGAVITVISALVGALVWFFTSTETGKGIWSSFVSSLQAGWQWLVNYLTPVWDGIVAAWNVAWGWISTAIGPVWTATVDALRAGWQWVSSTFSTVWDLFMQYTTWAWGNFQTYVVPVWNFTVDALKAGWNWVSNTFATVWNALVQYTQWAWGNFQTYVVPVWNAVISGLKLGYNWIINSLAYVWNELVAFWSTPIGWIRDAFGWIVDAASAWIDLLVNGNYSGKLAELLGLEEDSFIVSAVLGIRQAFSDLGTAWEELKAAFTGGDQGYGALASLIGEDRAKVIADLVAGIGDKFRALGAAWEELKAAFTGGDQGYGGLAALIGEDKAKLAADAVAKIGETFRNLGAAWEELKAAFTGGDQGYAGLAALIGEERAKAVADAVAGVHDKLVALKDFIVTQWETNVRPKIDAFAQQWEKLSHSIAPILEVIKGHLQVLWDKLTEFLSTIWEPVLKPALITLAAILSGPVVIAITSVVAVVGTFIAVIGSIAYVLVSLPLWVQQAVEAVKAWWNDLLARTQETFNAAGQAVSNWYNTHIATIPDRVKSAIDGAVNWFTQFPSRIQSVFANAGTWLIEAGKSIIRGLINGVRSMAGFVSDAIRSVVPDVVERHVPGLQFGGEIPGFAGGGRLPTTGPGTDRVDGILGVTAKGMPIARVNAGEYVVNRQSTEKYGNELRAINAGTFPRLPGYASGGEVADITDKELLDLARGSQSIPLQGAPYVWGGVKWGDCSGAMSAFANAADGRAPFGSRFATSNQASELTARGFRRGRGQPGDLRIGFVNGGPGGGHTAGTLPDGTNVEMGGGGSGGGKVGPHAAGAHDAYFTDFFFKPVKSATSEHAALDTAGVATQVPPTPNIEGVAKQELPKFDPTQAKPMSPQDAAAYGYQVANQVFWDEIGEGGLEGLAEQAFWDFFGAGDSLTKDLVDKAREPQSLPDWYGTTHPDNPATHTARESAEDTAEHAAQLTDEEKRKDPQLKGAVYDTGGWLRPGELAVNLSGKPEKILSPQDTEEYLRGEITVVVNVDGDEVLRRKVDATEKQVTINTRDIKDIKGERRPAGAGVHLLS